MSRQPTNAKIRREVLDRDFGMCGCCGFRQAEEVHHIVSRAYIGTDEKENLISLCSLCHKNAPDVRPNNEEDFSNWENYKRLGGYCTINLYGIVSQREDWWIGGNLVDTLKVLRKIMGTITRCEFNRVNGIEN